MSAREWLVATRNPGKLRELLELVRPVGATLLTLDEVGIAEHAEEAALEVFDTFEANALAKARYFFARSDGRPVLADDSGLEVRALGGAPGVRSKRWSGRTDVEGPALDAVNNALLVERLAGASDRRARYVCAAAFVDGDRELVRRGEVSGRIAESASGANGFGYDPWFVADELGVSFGVASTEEKARLSHRARAVAALVAALAGG